VSKKILIIEDDKDIVDLLKHYLTKEGYPKKDRGQCFQSKKGKSSGIIILRSKGTIGSKLYPEDTQPYYPA